MRTKLFILFLFIALSGYGQFDYYLTLPPESSKGIPVIVGETTTLYGNTLINIPLEPVETYTWEYICNVGSTVGENFVITPTSGDIGRHRLIVDVKKNGTTIARDTTTLSVHRKVNTESFSIMSIGDSNMANLWDYEMSTMEGIFDEATITTIGLYDYYSTGNYTTAIGGQHYYSYIAADGSPLTKDGVYDVPAYFADNSLDTPDFVYVRLGTNRLNSIIPDTLTDSYLNSWWLDWVQTFVDGFLDYDPDLKFIMALPPITTLSKAIWYEEYGGTTKEDSYDVFIHNAKKFHDALITMFMNPEYNERLYICFAPYYMDRNNHNDPLHHTSAGAEQITFGTAATINQILDEETDPYEETDTYNIYNPYYGVDWGQHYKANLTTHTTYGEGSESPATVINAYADAGYRILSITDIVSGSNGGSEDVWPWTDYITDTPLIWDNGFVSYRSALFPTLGDTLFAISGHMPTGTHYMGYYFFADATLYDTNLKFPIFANRGRAIWTRVGEYGNSAASYQSATDGRTNYINGFEVFNRGNRYPATLAKWDAYNALMPPHDLAWGYSNDDMTETSHLFRNYQHFLYREAENWFVPQLTERRLRQAMLDGSFYFSIEPDGNNQSSPTYGQADAPKLTGVTTNNSVITITGENYTSIEWYNNQTTLLGTGTSISVDTVSGNFVRAVLVNSSGSSYTQPFGFELKNEPYFVAPDGSDSNPGTKEAPFLTVQHGINQLTPGDTLYLRGGVYDITEGITIEYKRTDGLGPGQSRGTEQYPIVVSAYPPDHAAGNVPIIDGINACNFGNQITGVSISENQWWKFWGITVRNILQCDVAQPTRGWSIANGYNIYFEQLVAHNISGYAFRTASNAGVVHIRNSDAYNVADTLYAEPNKPGGRGSAFGFQGSLTDGYDPNTWGEAYVTGCRAWNFTDNGFSTHSSLRIVVDSVWSLLAGNPALWSSEWGDGRGIIANSNANNFYGNPTIIRNSIAAYNRTEQVVLNTRQRPHQVSVHYYNNFAIGGLTLESGGTLYKPAGFKMREATPTGQNEGAVIALRNNVVYGATKKMTDQSMYGWEWDTEMAWDGDWDWDDPDTDYSHEYNTWNYPAMTLTEADFVGPMDSLSIVTAMLAPRKPDGSLPDLPNLWPSANSQLRDAGVDVGLPYNGTAPDLGPFQYNPGETGHILIFQIENETGNAINNASITFNGATRPPGVYTLPGIEEGTYDFSVAAPGYENYVYNGLLVEEDMEISVVMTALPTYNLTFDVMDSNDNPISNGVVTLGDITNPLGIYSFTGIPAGTYNYSVSATGYQTVSVTGYEVNADVTIEVVMSPNIYTITINTSPSQGGTVSGQGSYTHGQTVNISAQANAGYNFVNWTENGNSVSTDPDYSFTATQNRNLTANFSEQTYTVGLSANPTGAGTLSGAGNYNYNAGVTINAQANTGYTFVNWTENGNVVSTNPQFSFNINSNRSFIANFTVNTYEIQASSSPSDGGSVTGAGTYSHGETAVLTATAADEYNFTYWRENGNVVSNHQEYSFTVTQDRNLTAHFALDIFEVTLLSLPEEAGDLFGAGNYEPGDLVSINALAKPGYIFHQWTDEGENVVSQEPLFNFIIEDHRTFTAHFLQETYTLTLTPNPTYGGLTEGAGNTFNYDQEVTVRAIPYSGFKFDAWTEFGAEVSSDTIYTFIMEGDRHLTANFSPLEYFIQVTVNPEEGGSVEGAGSYLHGDYVTLDAYPAQDYVFLQWLDTGLEVSQSPDLTFIANKDRNLEAVFVHVDELVRIDAQSFPQGYAFIEGAGDYPINRRVRLKAEPVTSDYSFVGWMENGRYIGHENPFLFNATEDRNITASFTYKPGELEVSAQLSIPETGHIYGTGNYSRGQVAILQAELHENVSFIGWKNQAGQIVSRQNPFNFEVNRSMDMTAMVELKDGMLNDDSQLRIYPNPSDGRFTVSIREEALMTVHNSQGIALETIRVTPEENQVNLGYLPSGVYFLRFQTQTEVMSRKVIIR